MRACSAVAKQPPGVPEGQEYGEPGGQHEVKGPYVGELVWFTCEHMSQPLVDASTHPLIGGTVTGVAAHPTARLVSKPQQLLRPQGMSWFEMQLLLPFPIEQLHPHCRSWTSFLHAIC
jgi:hypothetical protein